MKCLANIFAKFSPSENNHVYSTCALLQIAGGIDSDFEKVHYQAGIQTSKTETLLQCAKLTFKSYRHPSSVAETPIDQSPQPFSIDRNKKALFCD